MCDAERARSVTASPKRVAENAREQPAAVLAMTGALVSRVGGLKAVHDAVVQSCTLLSEGGVS